MTGMYCFAYVVVMPIVLCNCSTAFQHLWFDLSKYLRASGGSRICQGGGWGADCGDCEAQA